MKTELKIGAKYDKWTIVAFDCVDDKRRRRYLCKCECGIQRSVAAAEIANGRTKSCPRCKRDNLTGKIYGLWTVVSRSNKKSKNGYRTLWLCKCECGKKALVQRSNLISGGSKGCWTCRRDVIVTSKFPKIWYRKVLEQAKSRGHLFEMTEEDMWSIWENQKHICPLTGIELLITNDKNKTTASIDRINNELGYIKGNVWFIHKHINMMKFTYDLAYFVTMCKRVAEKMK